ncbi:hypothetical protein EKO27_g3362 [Xylaria grammica]|uniref:Nephrocystin 3-like N-terminal domain-containing protein n=1 Tax=Xylaria grammica TaxID=363999 RepID=A0A439DBH3_9PEZI|nr:hypothetical protein EKO27_g3362 [Xylaria grammica]
MATSAKQKTFRLRCCPADADTDRCVELLSTAFADIEPEGIRIRSLAANLDPWERPPTKVATLTFRITPILLREPSGRSEWILPVAGLKEPLILDSHFLGLTPLNDVQDETHEFDCIAISGLASHPFGSWQPKGEDKSFMWVREALPRSMPMCRAILYGYDTTLLNSNSFQTIVDLGSSLINHIKANGWHLAGSKPLVFLAHSLGGIVLKEAFSMMANGDDQGQLILNRFLGGIFFGVPSYGMKTSHLHAMVRGQLNEQVVKDLSTSSGYLRNLDDHFSGLVLTRQMRLCWAYETKASPTPERQEDGSYLRSGPEAILVTKESATRSYYHLRTTATFPINENHSDMVKFRQDDRNLHIVLSKLRGICGYDGLDSVNGDTKANWPRYPTYLISGRLNEQEVEAGRNMRWHLNPELRRRVINDLRKSLEVPGRDDRLVTIDDRFSRTFEWVFDEDSAIAKWIKEGTGMFWIHGKPASGKSTLMKFIFRSPKTWELLHNFSSKALQIKSAFFFYDRGALLQRSFEGLLRSVLHQIIQESDSLAVLLAGEILRDSSMTRFTAEGWTINTLESCIHFLLQQKHTNRPWDIFKRHFGDVPSLQLQDHTKDDIREYCVGFVESKGEAISVALDPVTSIVIERANGVFLWVKLVLQELIDEAAEGKRGEELSRILSAIPDDLRDYYARIIQRTPEKFRWEAYAIFQIITNGRDLFELGDLVRIVACSRSCTYQEARQSLVAFHSPPSSESASPGMILGQRKHAQRFRRLLSKVTRRTVRGNRTGINPITQEQRKSQIVTMTGGLIEFVRRDAPGTPDREMAQLAHQTVREFANGHDFKRTVLGHHARTIYENGHTFLARHSLANEDLLTSAPALFLHESTTGKSLQPFIDSLPEHLFREFPRAVERRHPTWKQVRVVYQSPVKGPLGFAVYNNLQLYLEDTLQRRPQALKETEEALLSIMPNPDLASVGTSPTEPFQVQLTLVRYLFDNGYALKQDPGAFQMIVQLLLEDLVYRNRALEDEHKFLEAKAAVLVYHGQPANKLLDVPDQQSRPNLPRNRVQAIHIATTIELIDSLVQKDVNIDTADEAGNRPLDHALASWDDKLIERFRESIT